MNRYSRITSKSKSKSVGRDHFSVAMSETPPITCKPHENDDKCINGEEGEGEIFGVILRRSRSVSSFKSMMEEERSSSMKRSSSYAAAGGRGGGYCGIHHQNDYRISHEQIHNFKKKEKGNKILRACIRLLGF